MLASSTARNGCFVKLLQTIIRQLLKLVSLQGATERCGMLTKYATMVLKAPLLSDHSHHGKHCLKLQYWPKLGFCCYCNPNWAQMHLILHTDLEASVTKTMSSILWQSGELHQCATVSDCTLAQKAT